MKYIAYGSNLNIKQMAFRCPDAVPVGPAIIRDMKLVFRGEPGYSYLTVEPEKGYSIPVVIWEVSKKDEKSLDRYEGYPTSYRKETVKLANGEKAFIYLMNGNRPECAPSRLYIETCIEGYKDFGFPTNFLYDACQSAIENEVLYYQKEN